MASVKTKKKNKYSIILAIGCVLLACYFTINLVGLQMDVKEQRGKLQEVNEQIEVQQDKNDVLKAMLKEPKDDYVQDVARKELGYIFPNERVYYNQQLADN